MYLYCLYYNYYSRNVCISILIPINEYYCIIFPGLTESSTQSSDFNGNRNSKTFPHLRDGPYMPQLSESHEHQLYSNRYVSILFKFYYLFLNNHVFLFNYKCKTSCIN